MGMKRKFILVLVSGLVLSVLALAVSGFAEATSWQKIEENAKAEGKVVVYSSSSRIFDAAETFQAKYGIEVEAHDLGSAETVEKTLREQEAGVYNADVIFTGGSEMIHQLLKEGYINNFVPESLADYIPAGYKEPLLVQRLGGGVIFYNTEKYPDGPPIDNIWDLTKPEWKGKVLTKNPLESLSTFGDFANLVAHADELKAAYEGKYGELVLSPGVPNAGYEFLFRLLRNDLVLMKSSGNVAKAIGTPGQDDPPIGFCRYSKIRYNETKGTVLGVARIDPVDIQVFPSYVAIAKNAPHPNAAKLMIAWLMGSPEAIGKKLEQPYNEGESARLLRGLVPWFVPGDWPPMTGYPLPKGVLSLEGLTVWLHDAEFIWNNSLRIQEFWMLYGG